MNDNTADTIGIEVEGVTQSREKVSSLLNNVPRDWITITRDASVESVARSYSENISIFMGNSLLRTNLLTSRQSEMVAGYEIVTNPLRRGRMKEAVTLILTGLRQGGEIFSPRSSIHYHVGFPYAHIFLKSAVQMGLKMEPLLFKIAGMGRAYRGAINNSAYARPLRSPPAIKRSDAPGFVVLNPADSINSDNDTTFWARFGIRPNENGRYVPLRYFGINVYSILLRRTIEYRVCNYTWNVSHATAVAEFCQCISDLMVRLPLSVIDSIPDISIFDSNSETDYLNLLDHINMLSSKYRSPYSISPEANYALAELISTTPQPVFSRDVIKTHLETYSLNGKSCGLECIDGATDPGVVSIHNFSKTDTSLS